MEHEFEAFMQQLQPNAGYMRLYREIVFDVWRKKQSDSQKLRGVLSRKVKELRENKTKLEESYIHRRSFDTETYQSMRAKLAEELTLAEMELRDAHAEEIEMETVLDYAEMVLTNASKPLESRAI